MGSDPAIPLPSLRRLPVYYRRLRQALDERLAVISSQELGDAADVPAAQVRKDLSHVGLVGRAGVGYEVAALAECLERLLGLVHDKEAVLVGVGNLARALISYPGFTRYGLRIVALFDADPAKVGTVLGEHRILPVSELADLTRRLQVQMGIITVPAEAAQFVAEQMVAGGITVIWNFAPTTLQVPDCILVKNEDLAAELATLSHHMSRRHLEHPSS